MKKDEDALIWVGGRNIRAGGLRESSKAAGEFVDRARFEALSFQKPASNSRSKHSLESTPIEGDFSPEAQY